MTHYTRREFTGLAATAVAMPFSRSQGTAGPGSLTAQALLDRIKSAIGVARKTETVDGFKAGDPAAIVSGIVTTAMATMDVLNRAVKAGGANLVITSEPTFYARADRQTGLQIPW